MHDYHGVFWQQIIISCCFVGKLVQLIKTSSKVQRCQSSQLILYWWMDSYTADNSRLIKLYILKDNRHRSDAEVVVVVVVRLQKYRNGKDV